MFSQTCAYLLLAAVQLVINKEDYWSDDFDEDKNCEQEELIKKLQKETSPSRCSSKMAGSFEVQWSECKKDLAKKLSNICDFLDIEQPGDFLYCKQRGQTYCCFHNESCSEEYKVVHDKMTKGAISFLKNTTGFLEGMVTKKNYDTCHAIIGYDASVCAKDCTELEKSTFAKNCSDSGGMFKCCIRRDKEFCHECRFCCTLSMCTSVDGTIFKGSKNLGDEHIEQEVNAKIGFETDRKMWKKGDYRCLKPKENLEPENWPHYEMKGFRSANTKDQLDNVMEIEFDKFFFNFEDPKMFKQMIKGAERESLWKKTYGFDYVSFNDKEGSKVADTDCLINCLKAEKRKFAKTCQKEGGFFKCCMSAFSTQPWHKLRHTLAGMNLINMTEQEQLCVKNGNKDTCLVCTITEICSTYNAITGQVEETFKTPYTINPQHSIGSTEDGSGLKYWVCYVLQTCRTDEQISPSLSAFQFVPLQDFKQAANQHQFCSLTLVSPETLGPRNETLQEAFYKECMKQKSNVFICPDTKEFQQNKITEDVTNVLKSIRKKLEQKKKRKMKNERKLKKKTSKKKKSKGLKKSGRNKDKKRNKETQKKQKKKKEAEKEEKTKRRT